MRTMMLLAFEPLIGIAVALFSLNTFNTSDCLYAKAFALLVLIALLVSALVSFCFRKHRCKAEMFLALSCLILLPFAYGSIMVLALSLEFILGSTQCLKTQTS